LQDALQAPFCSANRYLGKTRIALYIGSRYYLRMRRFIIIAMLFILPLQASWGALVAYSSHELTEAKLKLVGHGTYAEGKDAKHSAGDKATAGADDDCAVCHLAHHSNLILPPLGVSAPTFKLVRFASPVPADTVFTSLYFSRPERPKWPVVV